MAAYVYLILYPPNCRDGFMFLYVLSLLKDYIPSFSFDNMIEECGKIFSGKSSGCP